jgi:ACS family tartrate transporter-like MFS transporter
MALLPALIQRQDSRVTSERLQLSVPSIELPQRVDGPRLFRKIVWRLIPYLFLLYILAYLDRVNVGFAALQMKHDLRLSNTVYGTGAGIFFLGSALFDLPSNLMLVKIGPRRWIARIMISWGIIATGMMFVRGPISFYVLRFLLGVCEAGFFPGMILYLTYWFPSRQRAGAIAKFMTATSIAGVVGAPMSGWLLNLEGLLHLHGWQWLFLTEGIPSFLMGFSVLFLMKDKPDDAGWLSTDEKLWLDAELERDRQAGGAADKHRLMDAFKAPIIWLLSAICFIDQVGVYTVNLWMPLILTSFLHGGGAAATTLSPADASRISTYSTIPYIAAAIFTVAIGYSSDRSGERRGHIAGCMILSAIGFGWAGATHSLAAALIAFTLAAVGYWSIMGPFWTLPTSMLGGRAAAGGVAIIMMISGAGGFVGPYLTGRLRDLTRSFSGGLYTIAALTLVAAAMCWLLPKSKSNSSSHSL